MPITLTVTGVNPVGNQLRVLTNLVFTGSYPTGGDTIDLTTIIGQGHGIGIAVFNNLPLQADPSMGAGFGAEFIPGAALNNGKLKLFTTAGTELAAGTYAANAALLAASLNNSIEWVFDKLL